MKQEVRENKALQFAMAKEFIEERLCLSVSMTAIADFAAFIDNFEKQQTCKTKKLVYGGSYGKYKN